MRQTFAILCLFLLVCVSLEPVAASSAEVTKIQQGLTDLGYQPGPVDGAWGRKTEAAARRFLKDKSLDESAIFGSGGRDDGALLEHIKSVHTAENQAAEEAAIRAAKGLALIIGNAAYKHTKKLANPVKDSALIAAALEAVGFKITYLKDAEQKAMKKAMLVFSRKLRELGKPGFFYYAGHAVQVDGANYLVPVGAQVKDKAEVAFEGVPMHDFLRTLERESTSINMVVLDAYERNPYAASFRSVERGFARSNTPRGTYLAMASSPDQEGSGKGKEYSPYTWALANAMLTPGLPVEEVFKKARRDLLATTPEAQPPYEVSSVTGEFAFLDSNESLDKAVIIAASKKYGSPLSKFLNKTFNFTFKTPCCGTGRDRAYISKGKKVYWDTQSSGGCKNTGSVGEINRTKKFGYSCNIAGAGLLSIKGTVHTEVDGNKFTIINKTIGYLNNKYGVKDEQIVIFTYFDGKCDLLRRTWLSALDGKKQIATKLHCHVTDGR